MPGVYQVRYDPAALAALEEVVAYIEEESGAGRAGAWLEAMRDGIQKLEIFPRAFPAVCRLRGRTIRSKPVVSHRVFYFIEEPERLVTVIDVVHTARETRLAEYREPPG